MNYPHLFAPMRIRNTYFKNRIESAPMSHNGDIPFYTREAMEMFNTIAKGGAGVVTLGEAGVHAATGHAHPTMPHLDDTFVLPGLIQTVEQVHKWGALASIELTHSGNRAKGALLGPDGFVMGPSAMEANLYGDKVLEMDRAMMDLVCDAYAEAAALAKFAGIDIINIHGGHGWIISQFLSDLDNHRTDEFGGSLENKARFPLMVIDRIRQRCGPDTLIEFRLSADEDVPGGITPEETVELAKLLDGKVDIIHVSAATFHVTATASRMFPSVFHQRGCNVENAAKIKAVVKESKVSVVGGLNDPAFMDEMIAAGKADIAVVGRQFLADPNWPNKARHGRADEIISCIRCETCISAGFIPHVPFSSGVLRCSVNPTFGREYENTRREEKIERVKKVLVVGGGPAGMEAALTAARRGHKVLLCEKADHLAPALDYGRQIPFKYDIRNFVAGLETNLRRTENVEIRLETPVDEALIRAEAPDAIIVACGAEPIMPPIPGIDLPHVHHVTELYREGAEVGENVVIIGGGLAGCEEGLALADAGKKVTVVEMKPELAKDAPYIHWKILLTQVEKKLSTYCSARVLAIEPNGVRIADAEGKEQLLAADSVIIAAGMRATSERYDSWQALAEDVVVIGDCRKAAKIQDAMRTGYCAGLTV